MKIGGAKLHFRSTRVNPTSGTRLHDFKAPSIPLAFAERDLPRLACGDAVRIFSEPRGSRQKQAHAHADLPRPLTDKAIIWRAAPAKDFGPLAKSAAAQKFKPCDVEVMEYHSSDSDPGDNPNRKTARKIPAVFCARETRRQEFLQTQSNAWASELTRHRTTISTDQKPARLRHIKAHSSF